MGVIHTAKVLLGKALRPFHAGAAKLTSHQPRISAIPDITLRSDAFADGDPIPQRFAGLGEGQSISPPLEWFDVPFDTAELLLIAEDPDAPMPQPYIHWILYHISPTLTSLPEGIPPIPSPPIPAGATQGQNSANAIGYIGPLPPPGHGRHHYHFQLFALNQALKLPPNPDRNDLYQAMSNHVLAQGEIVGTYERK